MDFMSEELRLGALKGGVHLPGSHVFTNLLLPELVAL